MKFKALTLDLYGTLVHEDDEVLKVICDRAAKSANVTCTAEEVGVYWWRAYAELFLNSNGVSFKPQRELALLSLSDTLKHFHCDEDAVQLSRMQTDYWTTPELFEETKPFLQFLDEHGIRYIILSNIDTEEMKQALAHHGLDAVEAVSSEDVRAYKPHKELFQEGLSRLGLHPDQVLHVGDSVTSDAKGALDCGIPFAWINRSGKPAPEGLSAAYNCRNLAELQEKLLAAMSE